MTAVMLSAGFPADRTGSTLTWFMPALTNSRLGSPLGRTVEDGTSRCPCFCRKKSRKVLRTRAAGSSGGQPPKERAERAERRPAGPLTGRSLRERSLNIWTTDPDQTLTDPETEPDRTWAISTLSVTTGCYDAHAHSGRFYFSFLFIKQL